MPNSSLEWFRYMVNFVCNCLLKWQIYVWAMKTGRLLDILSGHEGPVHGLAFSPIHVRILSLILGLCFQKIVRSYGIQC